MNNKGIGMIVVWIFVLIAGGLIITLLFFISSNISEDAKAGLSLAALQRVDSILVTQQASSDTYVVIEIPKEPIAITCEPVRGGYISEMRIGGVGEDHTYRLAVGRDMETDQLIVFSKRAMIPFSIGNIVYVSNPQEALLINHNTMDSQVDALREELPPAIQERVYITAPSINAQNTNVRSVYFLSAPSSSAPPFLRPQSPQNAVYIEVVAERLQDSGYVRYWRYESGQFQTNGKQYHYTGTAMLLAYIWAGDDNRARCFTKKLAERIDHTTSIHIERFRLLFTESAGSACQAHYEAARLQSLKTSTQPSIDAFTQDFVTAARLVRLQNEALLRGVRCATIY